METKESLILFTNSFPFGKGEEFLDVEMKYLSEAFDNVTIIPYNPKGEDFRLLPDNVKVKRIEFNGLSKVNKLSIILCKAPFIFKWLFKGIYLSSNKSKYFQYSLWVLKTLTHRVIYLHLIDKFLKNNYSRDKMTLYSYWFNIWGGILTMLNNIDKNSKHLIRIHGYDYDIDQNDKGFFPFRSLEMNYIHHLSPISEYGKNYIKKNYPKASGVNSISELGVESNINNTLRNDEILTIVSCSSIIKIKRIHLIIKILKSSDSPINWVHFGDGPLFDEIYSAAKELPRNISFEFKGYVKNNEVLEYYNNNSIDFFVNVSSNEGIPVSIMEAISFGIPVIGCDVGGVSEIVTKETGHLIPKEIETQKVVDIFNNYAELSFEEKEQIRKGVKDYWKANYSAEVNYKSFIEKLKNL